MNEEDYTSSSFSSAHTNLKQIKLKTDIKTGYYMEDIICYRCQF